MGALSVVRANQADCASGCGYATRLNGYVVPCCLRSMREARRDRTSESGAGVGRLTLVQWTLVALSKSSEVVRWARRLAATR